MFNECFKLKKINENFNTSQVIMMREMFQKCRELEELDLTNFNTSKVNDMNYMFNECFKLKLIKGIENFNTNQIINMRIMPKDSHNLNETERERIYLKNK